MMLLLLLFYGAIKKISLSRGRDSHLVARCVCVLKDYRAEECSARDGKRKTKRIGEDLPKNIPVLLSTRCVYVLSENMSAFYDFNF
jgi:hypothetical protein